MNCPVCKTRSLEPHELNPYLVSKKCGTCGGQWISSFEFWKWLQGTRVHRPESAPCTLTETGPETRAAKICPECGCILAKYKVGHALDFTLDRCGHCGGIWFDRNEWEVLQSSDLHDKVHLIFSESWQQQVREEDRAQHLRKLFAEKIGEKDFQEITRIKEWLKQHPRAQELRAFLNSDEF